MSHDDFAIEPVRGLPERPPEGERILWQGRPDWWALTWQALSLPWVAGYFLALALWRFVTLIDTAPLSSAFASAFPFVIMGAVVCALLMIVGFVQARATVYTVTTRRVAMRIGAALTVDAEHSLQPHPVGRPGPAARRHRKHRARSRRR